MALALSALVVVPANATSPSAPENTFVIKDVRVFDGVRVAEAKSVLVVRGRIAAMGRFAAPKNAGVVDGRGKTLLPGLIDSHAHSLDPAKAAGDQRDALRFGVTTEVQMWGDPRLIAEARRQRGSLDRTDRADVWSAGTGVTVPGGLSDGLPGLPRYPTLPPDGDPARFVADRFREGSDFIKFVLDDGDLLVGRRFPTLTARQVRGLVVAAHRHGRQAVAHVTETEQTGTAVEAGVDGLVHVPADAAVDDSLVRSIRRHRTYVTPTLSVYDCSAGSQSLLGDPKVRPFLSAAQLGALELRWPNCPASWSRFSSGNVRALRAGGATIMAGTDAGAVFFAHGASLMAELRHLVSAGLSPAEALTAATATPAWRHRLGDRGRVAPGFRADLLLVNGNPVEHIDAVRDIAMIWKNGYRVDRAVA